MSEWKDYMGSEEQLKEIMCCKKGFALKADNGVCATAIFGIWPLFGKLELKRYLSVRGTTHYLICNPHPLEDMICQQARTGQEVWVLEPVVGTEEHPLWPRLLAEGISRENVGPALLENGIFCQYSTRTPYWHIPGAKYSFTRVGGYRANK